MSTINKKPFIKSLFEDLTGQELLKLSNLIDGTGDRSVILRTVNIKPTEIRPHITEADKGVGLCNLQLEYSLFDGYLVYTDKYCVLIYFTDSPCLGMFNIDVENSKLSTVDESLSVVELRMMINDYLINAGELVKVQIEDIDSGDEPAGKIMATDGNHGAVWTNAKAYISFPSSWPTTGTTKAFCDAVNADTSAVDGMVYVGELNCSDFAYWINKC